MLVQFSFSNFKCFKDETVLNLTTSKKKNKEFYSFDTRFNYRVLKTMAVYGANASGKSKLFEAVKFLKTLVLNAKDSEGDFLWKKKYDNFKLNTNSRDNSSSFEIVFIIDDNQYRYGVELTNEKIISEYLYVKDNKREVEVFKRSSGKISYNARFGAVAKLLIDRDMIKADMPFLSALNEWNDKMAEKVISWFQKLVIISCNDLPPVPNKYINEKTTKNFILKFLKMFDIGIEDISIYEAPTYEIDGKIKKLFSEEFLSKNSVYNGIKTTHSVYDEHYSAADTVFFLMEKDESFGTNRLLRLCLPLFTSSVVLIDEFDSGIHPNILNILISMFYNFGDIKKQLVFNTHNSSLLSRDLDYEFMPADYFDSASDIDLDIFKNEPNDISIKHPAKNKYKLLIKDQIYFVSKNRYGVASLVPLTDYKNIRSDLEQLYLRGLLDGTPNIRHSIVESIISREGTQWDQF